MKTLEKFESPQLKKIHAGKVRDSIRINDKKRMIVVTDRISAFNKNLKNSAIPYKGSGLKKQKILFQIISLSKLMTISAL